MQETHEQTPAEARAAAEQAYQQQRQQPSQPLLGSYMPEPSTHGLEEADYGVVDYFGHPIRVVLDPLSLELTLEEFMDVASTMEEDDMRAVGTVRTFLRTMIHPDDFAKFWRLVRENRQDIFQQMSFGKWLVVQVSGGHPTAQPSDSSGGRPSTQENSEDDVSQRVQRRLEQSGRPDLAAMVLVRREYAEAHDHG